MKTEKEVKALKYPELQKYASIVEDKSEVQIDRSANKVNLLKAVLDAMAKIPKTEETSESETSEEKTEETESKEEEEPKDEGPQMYTATKKYSDWESKISFDPYNPEMNKPFKIPKMTSGLENAIAKGIVVPVK